MAGLFFLINVGFHNKRINGYIDMALRLGVDALNLVHDRRGIGRYARALLRRWLTQSSDRVAVTLLLPHLVPRLAQRRYARELGLEDVHVGRRSDARRLAFDLVWYPWNGMTWLAPQPKVATVHDVWPFASPSPNLRIRRNEQVPFERTALHARRIIADSQFTKSEIVRYLRVDAERISVVPLGVDPVTHAPQTETFDGIDRYVLFVGEAEGRKDLATLVEAMSLLPNNLRGIALLVAGRARPFAHHGVRIAFEGEVSEERLAALYRGAAIFVLPSRYEGFGLPVLEAMANGTPVIASDAASLPEAGGDAALYFPAGDATALARSIGRLLTDQAFAERMRAAGRARAGEFTWDRCAESTLRILEEEM